MAASNQMSMAKRRIHKEWADIQKEDLGKMTIAPKDDDMFTWEAHLPGPEGSLYEGGLFTVLIQLPPDYPFTPPKATFKSRIYHMNISDAGNICIDILKTNWSPALSLLKVVLSLSSLLTDPNPKDPLVPAIANQYTRSRKKHDETAREWTRLYAMPKPVPAPAPAPAPAPPKASSSRGSRTAAPRGGVSRVIEILDDDDVVPVVSTGRRRREPEEGSGPSRKKKKPNGSSSSASRGAVGGSTTSQDVIVID